MNKGLALVATLVLVLSLVIGSLSVKGQTTENIVINPDGSVTGTNSIQQVGNTYSLTANISGNIQVERSNIVIDGAGYSLSNGGIDLTNNIQHQPNNPTINNITIENLFILNGGIGTNGGGNDTFYNDYISNSGVCIMLVGASYNNITNCDLNSTDDEAIGMMEGASYNSITENNIAGGINLFLSVNENVDMNYWSDYSTKYPNATEVDNSGAGDQPYVYYYAQNILPNGTESPIIYQDNHPLMKPVIIPLTASSSPTPSPTVPELPVLLIMPLLLSMLVVAVLFRHRKTANSS